MGKEERYLEISKKICELAGGTGNMTGVAHCATRLRIVLNDKDLVKIEEIENVDLVKGVFVAGDQLQIIFGAGLVNDVYDVFAKYTHMENMSLSDVKAQSAQKKNPIQRVIKSLSDVFVDIIPGILAAALFMGLTSVLGQWDVVAGNATLSGINRLLSLASTGIFAILPLAICYSATKRYGGKPILGIVVGAIMLDSSLANAYSVGSGAVVPDVIHIFGLPVEMVGFQGGIIIALMMGFVVASLDKFFDRKIPDVVKLLVSPLLTVFTSTVLLFTVVGPAGRALSNIISGSLIWMTNNLGVVGYMIFGGLQQIIVITGLHHIIGAVEAQLIADTGRNFLNPLMSVALMGQGGAVLGYLALNWKDVKAREICIPSFASTLFGISEPAIFGVNLRYKFPLIGGCLGGAIAGGYVYFAGMAALGFGTTAVPGIAIADPANNGYLNYVIAHLIALGCGFGFTVLISRFRNKKKAVSEEAIGQRIVDAASDESMKANRNPEKTSGATSATTSEATPETTSEAKSEAIPEAALEAASKAEPELFTGVIDVKTPMAGKVRDISESSDPTFAAGILGKGIIIDGGNGEVYAPADATVQFVFDTKHAVGLRFTDGTEVIIHCGIDTVNLKGNGFDVAVKDGQAVKQGEFIMKFDPAVLAESGYSDQTVMAFTKIEDGRNLSVMPAESAGLDTCIARLS